MLETNCFLSCPSTNPSNYSRREGTYQLAEIVNQIVEKEE